MDSRARAEDVRSFKVDRKFAAPRRACRPLPDLPRAAIARLVVVLLLDVPQEIINVEKIHMVKKNELVVGGINLPTGMIDHSSI
jgi:hypothetical protein